LLPSYGFNTAAEPARTGGRATEAELASAEPAPAGAEAEPAELGAALAGENAELAGLDAALAGTATGDLTSLGRLNWTRIVKFATLR